MNWLTDAGIFFGILSRMFSPPKRHFPVFNDYMPVFSYSYPSYTQNNFLVGNTLTGVITSDNYYGPSLMSILNTANTVPQSNYYTVGNTLSSIPSTGLYCGCYNFYDNSITMPPMYGTYGFGNSLCTTNLNTGPLTLKQTTSQSASVSELNTAQANSNKVQSETPVYDDTAVGTNSTILKSNGKVKISKDIEKRIKQIAKKLNCDYKDLYGLMWCESRFDPAVWYGASAVGLIQFTQPCVNELNRIYGLNLTLEKIAKMSALEQLDLVEKSLLRAKQIAGFSSSYKLSAGELYAINLTPAYAKRQNYVLSKKDPNGYYAGNSGLDINKDGYITHDELSTFIKNGKVNVIC